MDDFRFSIGHEYIGARFFDEAPYVCQHFVSMLTTIANATDADFSDLPAVMFIDFGDRYFKLVANSGY